MRYEKLHVVRPDINIILNLPLEIALKRKNAQKQVRGEKLDAHEKSETHLANAWAAYHWLTKHHPDEFTLVETIEDAYELTPKEVLERVRHSYNL